MIFSGIPFLYYYFPCVLVLYYLAPRTYKNGVLLLSSLVFYAWGEPSYVFLMIATILVGYLTGFWTDKYRGTRKSKFCFVLGSIFCIGALVYFKYAGFFLENINGLLGLVSSWSGFAEVGTTQMESSEFLLPVVRAALPVGISFYTFQILSYMIDVYRGDVSVQKSIVSFGAYVTMFPQLIAGPIVRYGDIAKQLDYRRLDFHGTALGIRRFVFGFGKKILIANQLGELCDIFHASDEKSILFYWMYAIAVSLQIYFDFSGYSDMAIGLGRILGFQFPENFNYPFIAWSITEFWRRWHMTLGTWFRDYVYIPLGGNRVKKNRWFFNLFLVWMLTGFWHGAAWNFIIWGLYFAVLLLIEKQWLLIHLKKAKIWNHIYVLLTVVISFVIFDAIDMPSAVNSIGCMFGFGDVPMISAESIYYLRSYGILIVLAVIGATPVLNRIVTSVLNEDDLESAAHAGGNGFCWRKVFMTIAEPIVLILLLLLCTSYLVDGSFNPFLYFRF